MQTSYAKIAGAFLLIALFAFYGCEQSNITDVDPAQEEQIDSRAGDPIPGQYIVVFKNTDSKGKTISGIQVDDMRSSILRDNRISSEAVFNQYNKALPGFAANLSDEELNRLKADRRVDYIEQDKVIALAPPCGTPNGGPCDGDGGGDGGSGQTTPWGITRVGGPVASSGTAWILDSGIDLDHPDLNVDVNRSATFITRGKDSKNADDGNGHGTHVAGTIAALDNDIDVVGVAPGASVVAVKVLDSRGSGSYSGVIAGVDYVAANASNGDVANMSLGGPTSQALDDAIRNAADAGVKFALAAGNDADNANNYSPARVEYNNVWTVSATDESDNFASFSNYSGPTDPPIEFAAPGVGVLSLYKDGGTATLNGTSMASPHVAGLLLLGNPTADGSANGDPDGDPDPIAHN
ncbi:MAG: S8 family peptidase [Balneolaceae bacterium]|nr:S8 family peptidase [Balneolaceae bacterium]